MSSDLSACISKLQNLRELSLPEWIFSGFSPPDNDDDDDDDDEVYNTYQLRWPPRLESMQINGDVPVNHAFWSKLWATGRIL
jgi:hypothetical protein